MLHNVAARLRAGGETPWFFRWNGLANRTAMRVLGTPVKPGEAAARTTNPEVGGSNPPGRAKAKPLGKLVPGGLSFSPPRSGSMQARSTPAGRGTVHHP